MNQAASTRSLFTIATTGERVHDLLQLERPSLAQMQQITVSPKIAQNFAYFPLDDAENSSQGFLGESFCGIEHGHLGQDGRNTRKNTGLQVSDGTALI